MKHSQVSILFGLLISLMTWAQAQTIVRVHWPDLCREAAGKQLVATTVDGNRVEGHCMTVEDDEVRLLSPTGNVIRMTRVSLSGIELHRRRERQLVSLRKGIGGALSQEAKLVFSPFAPVGVAALPATLAWGVVAAPFCLVADLTHRGQARPELVQLY